MVLEMIERRAAACFKQFFCCDTRRLASCDVVDAAACEVRRQAGC